MTNSNIEHDNVEGLLAEQCLDNFDENVVNDNLTKNETPDEIKYQSVAIPSHQMMERLLRLFAGRTHCIAEDKIFGDRHLKNGENDREVEGFVKEVIQEKVVKETYNEFNELVKQAEQTAIISDNPQVSGTASIPEELFSSNLVNREEELAFYIRKTFGAEGLRHFLGIIIGLEENGRKGTYRFTMNEHLERLGYSRSKGGSFDPALKKKAFQIIQILCSLKLTIAYKQKGKQKIACLTLFNLNRFDMEADAASSRATLTGFTIQANDEWYGSAFKKTEKRSQQYTKLLRRVAFENHGKHPFVLYLAARFAIRWRINSYNAFRLKLRTIMEMCGLDTTSANRVRMRDLAQVIKELDFMMKQGYLGSWQLARPVSKKKQLDGVVVLEPPSWLAPNKSQGEVSKGTFPRVTPAGLHFIKKQTGLNQSQLAKELGVSRQHICNILKEKNWVSAKLSRKITEKFGHVFDEMSTKSCPTGSETLPLLLQNPTHAAANENGIASEVFIHAAYGGVQ